jgi:hypothetical protein
VREAGLGFLFEPIQTIGHPVRVAASTPSKSKEACDKVRDYEKTLEKAGPNYE